MSIPMYGISLVYYGNGKNINIILRNHLMKLAIYIKKNEQVHITEEYSYNINISTVADTL